MGITCPRPHNLVSGFSSFPVASQRLLAGFWLASAEYLAALPPPEVLVDLRATPNALGQWRHNLEFWVAGGVGRVDAARVRGGVALHFSIHHSPRLFQVSFPVYSAR